MTSPVTWATISDVQTITGTTVDATRLGEAQGIIELYVGRTIESTRWLQASSLRWLQKAVAYQAAWMEAQPDLFVRTSVDTFGSRTDLVKFKADSQLLAPLARRALKRLRWKGTHSTYTPSTLDNRRPGYPGGGRDGILAVHDYPGENWSSMDDYE